jgi:hypothetical protein
MCCRIGPASSPSSDQRQRRAKIVAIAAFDTPPFGCKRQACSAGRAKNGEAAKSLGWPGFSCCSFAVLFVAWPGLAAVAWRGHPTRRTLTGPMADVQLAASTIESEESVPAAHCPGMHSSSAGRSLPSRVQRGSRGPPPPVPGVESMGSRRAHSSEIHNGPSY